MHLGLLIARTWVPAVLACPYGENATDARQAHAFAMDDAAATHCATDTGLVGTSCSYSTGLMARRVIDEGRAWSRVAKLTSVRDPLESGVASPYRVGGEDDGYRVIANELVQILSDGGHLGDDLALTGKWLEVDGVRYVVLTSYKVVDG